MYNNLYKVYHRRYGSSSAISNRKSYAMVKEEPHHFKRLYNCEIVIIIVEHLYNRGEGMDILWYIFDMVGTIAFAVSGALVGVSRKMDIFGIAVLALATAIGGGIVRDVLLGYLPPNSLRHIVYIAVVLVVVAIVFVAYSSRYHHHVMGPRSRAVYLLADALGLASFTVTGAAVGYAMHPSLPIFIVLLGTITAVGGGIIRDLLARLIPSVLREDVYALPSIIGGIVYYVLVIHDVAVGANYVAFTVVLIIRLLAITYNWSLPKVR